MFNHVLLPTDGSEGSLRAAAIVAELAKHNPKARATVICAIAIADPNRSDLDATLIEQQNHAVRHHAEMAIEKTCRIFQNNGIPCEGKVVVGDPVSAAIVEQAGKRDVDVIAMASRGLTMKRNDRHYLGSVTDHVLRQVSIPVLVLPVREEV